MAQTPNILFLFTDDQRYDTLGALNNDQIHTPNMDRLVRSGVSFTNAYIPGGTTDAVCMPSRAMIHTGKSLFHLENCGESIPEEHTLLGELFQRAGYATFGTGKWHNGRRSYARSFSTGAEIFFGGMDDHWNVPAHDFDPRGTYDSVCPQIPRPRENNHVVLRECDHITAGKHSSELFADATIDFLTRRDPAQPFFAYVSFMAPHDPRSMPERFLEMYSAETVPFPGNFLGGHPFDNGGLKERDELLAGFPRDPNEVRQHIAEYYAMISHLDHEIGRILDALEEKGLAGNTIIVFAGDNGLALGSHGLMGKQNLYEHSVRVPLVICGPDIPEHETRSQYVYLLDLYPTLCELAGISLPEPPDGASLVSSLHDSEATPRETLFFAYRHSCRAVRDDRYKLIEYALEGTRVTQLFDLLEDPGETRNHAGEPAYSEVLERLRSRLRDYRESWDDHLPDLGKEFWRRVGSTAATAN